MATLFTNPFSVRQRIFFVLYTRFEKLLYVAYHENAINVARWLELENDDVAVGYISHPAISGPDVCGRCHGYHGITLSGRIREGCILCSGRVHEYNRFSGYVYQRLAEILKLSQEQVELGLAFAILEIAERNDRLNTSLR